MNLPAFGVAVYSLMCSGKVPWVTTLARGLSPPPPSQLQGIRPFALAASSRSYGAAELPDSFTRPSALPRCPSDFVSGLLLRPPPQDFSHWHCFAAAAGLMAVFLRFINGWLCASLPSSAVVTTSPLLAQELQRRGCAPAVVCPALLLISSRSSWFRLPLPEARAGEPLRVLFIGRLDTKRLDWLLESLAMLTSSWQLVWSVMVPNGLILNSWPSALPQTSRVRFLPFARGRQVEQVAAADLLSCLRIAAMKRSALCNWRRWWLAVYPCV